MRTSIATVSLSGPLPEKLKAIAAAGYDEVEIFEADFLSYNGSARDIARMVGDLGLKIAAWQPFRDFEGLLGEARTQVFRRAEAKFDLMQEIGADLMLVCSSIAPHAVGGIDRAAADFRDLGERAARRGLKVGYEALAWGRHVSDYRDAWEIVRRANHPAIGLTVDEVATTMQRADRMLAQSFHQPVGPGELEIPAIRGVGGSLLYFLEPRGDFAQVWEREFRQVGLSTHAGVGLKRVDHIAQSMMYDEMLSWALFYTSIFAVSPLEQLDLADPGGLVQSRALVSPEGGVRIALNGSMASRTLSARFLAEFFGSGVQHIAFETHDILASVEAMRQRGLQFLEIPDNYYDDLEARYDLDPALARRLRENRILYDRDATGEFFQIYTEAFAERFFFEIVERRSYTGFGAANAPIRLAAQARRARPVNIPKDSEAT